MERFGGTPTLVMFATIKNFPSGSKVNVRGSIPCESTCSTSVGLPVAVSIEKRAMLFSPPSVLRFVA
jgi:hypothetical protein